MTLLLTTSCVVPIPASPEDSDAGPRRDTPTIVMASPADFPGPLQLPGTPMITYTLHDGDVSDTLYLRIFKNYTPATAGLGIGGDIVLPSATASELRTSSLTTGTWCTGSAGQNVIIDVVVADEPFEDLNPSGDFPFKTPKNGGRWSERNFFVACSP